MVIIGISHDEREQWIALIIRVVTFRWMLVGAFFVRVGHGSDLYFANINTDIITCIVWSFLFFFVHFFPISHFFIPYPCSPLYFLNAIQIYKYLNFFIS